jgi:hypothetical protein
MTASSLHNEKIEDCALGVMKKIIFPEPLGGGVVYSFSRFARSARSRSVVTGA